MGIEVKFISKELIKPSSPTPNHLTKFKFSFIDQNQFPVSIPIVLFYEKSNNFSNQQRSILLKQSLSKALTIFYPLAGRINNYSYADCNDKGALFTEAKANCQLSDILQNRNQYHNNSQKFFPVQPEKGIHQYGSLFQITYFNCGGLAVSFAMAHMLGDGLSMFVFLNVWGAVTRGSTFEIPPIVSDSIFPPRNISGFDLTQWSFKENVLTKSFVFDAFAISALRDKYSANSGEKLSKVLALSVFILSRMIAATSSQPKKTGDNSTDRCMVIYSVNVRELLDPPISKQAFGNLICAAPTLIDSTGKEDDKKYYEIGKRIKDSITSVNSEAVKKLQNGEFNFSMSSFMECIKGEIVRYSFTSLCHFPMYEVDFGWGKPEWVATSMMFLDNFIMLVDTKEGRGIEAWISFTEEEMAKFENDEQLRSYLSSTTNRNSRL